MQQYEKRVKCISSHSVTYCAHIQFFLTVPVLITELIATVLLFFRSTSVPRARRAALGRTPASRQRALR